MEGLLIIAAIAIINALANRYAKKQKEAKERELQQQARPEHHSRPEGPTHQSANRPAYSSPHPANPHSAPPSEPAAKKQKHKETTELPDLVKNIFEEIGLEMPPAEPPVQKEPDLALEEEFDEEPFMDASKEGDEERLVEHPYEVPGSRKSLQKKRKRVKMAKEEMRDKVKWAVILGPSKTRQKRDGTKAFF